MTLNRNDPRPAFRQVADQLRAGILAGRFEPKAKLPSQAELSAQFGVARMTVQQALRELRHEGLIVSRQGSGVYVRDPHALTVDVRPVIEQAFEAGDAAIDFVGFTAETLHNALQEPLDKVRHGYLAPRKIRLRLLLADPDADLMIPRPVEGGGAPVRERLRRISDRYAGGLVESFNELSTLGVLRNGSIEVRHIPTSPMVKVYLINDRELLFGWYPVVRHEVTIDGHPTLIDDPMGKDAVLFRKSVKSGEPEAPAYVAAARTWFDSVWSTVAKRA